MTVDATRRAAPAALPADRTVDRALVHKRAVEQVLTTAVAEHGGKLLGAAQLPRLHRYYNDTCAPYYDLLLVGEAARQTVEAIAHQLLGVALDQRFVIATLEIALTDPAAFRITAAPADLQVELCPDRVRRRRDGSVRGLVGEAICRTGGREAASFRGELRFVDEESYAQLRAGPAADGDPHPGAGQPCDGGSPSEPAPPPGVGPLPEPGSPPQAGPPAEAAPLPEPGPPSETASPASAGPLPEPAAVGRPEPAAVGRRDARNVVITTPRPHGPHLGARIVCDRHDPVFFDHPLDHLPGMLLLEAGRQLALAAVAEATAVPAGQWVATACRARFLRFAELAQPVWCRGQVTSPTVVEVTVEQGGMAAAHLEFTVTGLGDGGLAP